MGTAHPSDQLRICVSKLSRVPSAVGFEATDAVALLDPDQTVGLQFVDSARECVS